MNRIDVVNARAEALKGMSTEAVVSFTRNYFKENKTLPGEKKIRSAAEQLAAELGQEADPKTLSYDHNEMAEIVADAVVKEIKLHHVTTLNETKQNKDAEGVKPSELPLTLVETMPTKVLNTMRNTYKLDITICDGKAVVTDAEEPVILAEIPVNFRNNHTAIEGMRGTVLATDHSNGKFANMSYSLILDLGQNCLAA